MSRIKCRRDVVIAGGGVGLVDMLCEIPQNSRKWALCYAGTATFGFFLYVPSPELMYDMLCFQRLGDDSGSRFWQWSCTLHSASRRYKGSTADSRLTVRLAMHRIQHIANGGW